MLLEQHPNLIVNFSVDRPEQIKDYAKKIQGSLKVEEMVRSHHFIVRSGGHIDSWQPLYRLVYIHTMNTAWWSSVFVVAVVMACRWRSLLSYLEPVDAVMHVQCMLTCYATMDRVQCKRLLLYPSLLQRTGFRCCCFQML